MSQQLVALHTTDDFNLTIRGGREFEPTAKMSAKISKLKVNMAL